MSRPIQVIRRLSFLGLLLLGACARTPVAPVIERSHDSSAARAASPAVMPPTETTSSGVQPLPIAKPLSVEPLPKAPDDGALTDSLVTPGANRGATVAQSVPAVTAILAMANSDLASSRPLAARAKLERALNLDPDDPWVWHALAKANFLDGNYEQALASAERSNALSRADEAVRLANWRLIEAVREASGDVDGAQDAAAEAAMLQ